MVQEVRVILIFVCLILRGEFLRGFDNAAGNDPDSRFRTGGDAVGSSQSQSYALQIHSHKYTLLVLGKQGTLEHK